jgi:uridine kinase
MIYENIEIKEAYFELTGELIKRLEQKSLLKKEKLVIGVCGESGSGKSVTAICLQKELEKQNIPAVILHQDSYYKLPPKENHAKRKADISWVGYNEVKFDLIRSHIEQFRSHADKLTVPVVDYEKNIFLERDVDIKDTRVLIVEGVYSFIIEEFDYKVFMARNYKDTLENRKKRTRETYDPFVEKVLQIEHSLISPFKEKADAVITNDYNLMDEG